MTQPVSLVIGQLRLIRGVRQDEALTTGVFEPRAFLRRQDPGILFILIDLLNETPDDDTLLGELMAVMRHTYERWEGSTTRRLRYAVAAAHHYLRRWNQQRTDGKQAAGISCAALVGDELYLAQAGPALAFVAQPGVIEQFPAESPWLTRKPLEFMPRGIWAPVGLEDEVYVHLNYTQVGPGYTLCLVSAHLVQLLGEDEIAPLLDQDPEDTLRDLIAIASGRSFSALLAGLLEPEPAEVAVPEPEPEPRGPGLRQRLSVAVRRVLLAVVLASVMVLGGLAKILEALLPERVGNESAEMSERRQQALMWLAIVIPIALGLLTAAMYWGAQGDQDVQFLNLMQSATEHAGQARALTDTDPGQSRQLLLTASQELGLALRLRPDDEMAMRLRKDVQSQLDKIDGVVRLSSVASIAALPGTAEDRRRLVVQGSTAYVLNNREQVVHRVELEDQRIVEVLKSEETRGERLVGPLVDMAWVPAGGVRDQGAVIVLDSTGTAWQISPLGEVLPLKVAGAEEWQGLRLIGGFAGNLYVLDVGLGRILKYSPTVDGYAIPPVDWLSPQADVALDDVVDMAIDGSIYLFRSSKRVEKLVAGKPEPFDQPDEFDLAEPVACFAAPPSDTVFLADTHRILQLDTAGTFQRQLLPPEGEWQRLSALWIDEANGRLYAVDAGTLVTGILP